MVNREKHKMLPKWEQEVSWRARNHPETVLPEAPALTTQLTLLEVPALPREKLTYGSNLH